MRTEAAGSMACLLCGGGALAPAFYPPLVRCRDCGLVFRDVPNGGEQVARGFDEVYRRGDADRLVQERRTVLYAEFLARHAPAPGRNRLLDVGCGTGAFLEQARRAGWTVLGLEVAESAVDMGLAAGIPMRLGSLVSASLPASSFDVVTLWNVLDCLRDPLGELRASWGVLSPGGLLMARVCNLRFHAALYRAARLARVCPPLARALGRQCFFSQASFDARTLRALLERAGFADVSISNSRPSDGDPYGTLPRETEAAARAVKRSVHLVVRAIAAGSRGRLLLGSSLSAIALKGGAA